MTNLRFRQREAGDLAVLTTILAEQQSESRYPLRWPLPFPIEDFLVRDTEVAAWVAEVDGDVAGHVSVCSVTPGVVAAGYRTALGADAAARLRLISVLLVDVQHRGRGLGRQLLDHAVAWIRERELTPALDVLPVHEPAVALYRSAGWLEVARVRPEWLPDGEPDMVLMTLPPG